MNGPHTPAYVKDNPFTRLINRVAEINAMDGKPAGRAASQAAEHFRPAIPEHQFKHMTPGQQRAVLHAPEFDLQEMREAQARAQALGVIDTDEDDLPPTMQGPSMEDIEAMIPQRLARTAAATAPSPAGPRVPQGVRQTGGARMPDFKKVEGFDLLNEQVIIDGMAFPIPKDGVTDLKKFAIEIALAAVTVNLAQALIALGVPAELANEAASAAQKAAQAKGLKPDGGAKQETVHEVPADEEADELLQEREVPDEPVQAVPVDDAEELLSGLAESVESMASGSSGEGESEGQEA